MREYIKSSDIMTTAGIPLDVQLTRDASGGRCLRRLALLLMLLAVSASGYAQDPPPPEEGDDVTPGFCTPTPDNETFTWALHAHAPDPATGPCRVVWQIISHSDLEIHDEDWRVIPAGGLFLSTIGVVQTAGNSVRIECWLEVAPRDPITGQLGELEEITGTRTETTLCDHRNSSGGRAR